MNFPKGMELSLQLLLMPFFVGMARGLPSQRGHSSCFDRSITRYPRIGIKRKVLEYVSSVQCCGLPERSVSAD